VRDGAARELEVDEGDVGGLRQHEAAAQRAHVRGPLVEPVVEDREVVRAEVPDDADVGLVEAEVDPARGDEVELAEHAALDQVPDRDDGRAVEEGMAGHQHQVPIGGELDQLEALAARGRERLLDEDVLTGLERAPGEGVMAGHGGRDRHRLQRLVRQELVVALVAPDAREAPSEQLQPLGVVVVDADEVGAVELVQVPGELRAPVAEADDGAADGRVHAVAFRCRRSAKGVRSSSRRSRPSDQPRT
jgi:hypothetical protein